MRMILTNKKFLLLALTMVCVAWVYMSWADEDTGGAIENLDLVSQIYELVRTTYLEPTDPGILAEGAVQGMLRSVSPYCYLMPSSDHSALIPPRGPVDAGLIIGFRQDLIEVIDVLPGSPAAQKNLYPGDVILRIRDQVAPMLNILIACRLLSGQPGDRIEMIVQHEQSRMFEEITLELTEPAPIEKAEYTRKNQIDFLDLPRRIDRGNIAGILALLGRNTQSMPDGLVIDARSVNEGDDETGLQLADYFIADGETIGAWCSRQPERKTILKGSDGLANTAFPVAIIVDSTTSGPGVVFAGAMQIAQRAAVTGGSTFDKAVHYREVKLNDDFTMFIVDGSFCLPGADTGAGQAVQPDYFVSYPPEGDEDPFITLALNTIQFQKSSS